MTSEELLRKAAIAVQSSKLLLDAGDLDGACNRAYYAMFDAARAALLFEGSTSSLASIKTHSGQISAFSLELDKTGKVSVDLGKAIIKVEDLRMVADYRGDQPVHAGHRRGIHIRHSGATRAQGLGAPLPGHQTHP